MLDCKWRITCSRFTECGDRSVAFDKTAPKYQLTQHLETDVRQETVRDTHPNPNTMGNRDVDQLSHVDLVPTNTHSSEGESQLHIFEDNEAVIKKIIERQKSSNETRVKNPQGCA